MKLPAMLSLTLGPDSFPVLGAAWRWWIGELAAMAPASLRRLLAGSKQRMLVLVDEAGAAEIVLEAADGTRTLGFVDLKAAGPADGLSDSISALQSRGGPDRVVVRLPASTALRSTIALPATASRNLAQAIAFELRRQTPFKLDEILYAFRVSGRDPATKMIFFNLTVVRRRAVETLAAGLRNLGMEPTSVEVAGSDAAEPVSPDLMARQARARSLPAPSLAIAALSTLAVLLALASVAIPLHRDRTALDALDTERDQARRLADESLRLQKEIDARIEEGGFLADRKAKAASASEILYALTRLLPDDTSLIELRIDGRTVEIRGLTSSASTVIGLLDKSPDFASPTFRSAMTQDQATGREQFDLAVQLASGKTP